MIVVFLTAMIHSISVAVLKQLRFCKEMMISRGEAEKILNAEPLQRNGAERTFKKVVFPHLKTKGTAGEKEAENLILIFYHDGKNSEPGKWWNQAAIALLAKALLNLENMENRQHTLHDCYKYVEELLETEEYGNWSTNEKENILATIRTSFLMN
jgi:hypothetical protein